MASSSTNRADALSAAVLWTIALGIGAALAWVLLDVVRGAAGATSPWLTYLSSPPADQGASGGIASVLVSTLLLLALALAVALPLGLGTAVLLTEAATARGDSSLVSVVRLAMHVLAGTPSIVFGLFGGVLFVEVLGLGYSLAAGGLTLGCMVLPIFVRAAESSLRAVPVEWRAGAAALGLSRFACLRRVVLPAALPGIAAGLVLGIGRALAETAALLFTAGAVLRMPSSIGDSGRSLSVHIYELSMFVPGGEAAAYRAAAVLVALLLALNLGAAAIVRIGQRHGAQG